jgi:hypothetical protein
MGHLIVENMPAKKYIVSLTKEEQKSLEELTKTGKAAAAKINHAKILLKADINREEGGWKDQAISIALDTSVSTIETSASTLCRRRIRVSIESPSAHLLPKKVGWRNRSSFNRHCLFRSTRRKQSLDITLVS